MTRAIIRRKGAAPISKSFPTKRAAAEWMAETETALKHRKVFAGGMTLGQVLQKYVDKIVAKRKTDSNRQPFLRLSAKFADTDFSSMTPQWWLDTISDFEVSPVSACRYVAAMTSAMRTASNLWGVTVDFDAYRKGRKEAEKAGLLDRGEARDRVFSPGEYERLIAVEIDTSMPMRDLIDFAIATCMRVAEICRITWADFDEQAKMQWIRQRKDPKRKATNHQRIPLLFGAVDIIKRQPRTDARIFPYDSQYLGMTFKTMCKRAGIEDFVFHDLRHVGITNMFAAGYSIQDVAMVSGHKEWKTLKGYVTDKPESLHLGPDRHRVAA
jgi:integrase